MENLFIILAVIGIMIFKAVNKSLAGTSDTADTKPQDTPDMPVPWNPVRPMDELLNPVPIDPDEQTPRKSPKKNKKKKARLTSDASQMFDRALEVDTKEARKQKADTLKARAQKNRKQKVGTQEVGTLKDYNVSSTPCNAVEAAEEPEDDFAIRSAEEARRAIIWGEILQRKY